MFKTIKINDNKFWNLLNAYDFSVSKANIIASILICLISIGLFIKDALSIYSSITNKDLIYLIQAHQSIAIFVIFMSLCIALIIIALIIIGFFSRGFASKLEPEHTIDSEFIMSSDSYKNFKESK